MATIPNPAALLAPALPLPLQSGQLLAFAGPSYPPQAGEASIATDAVQTIGTGVEPLVSGPLPPVATVPPIGGFAPFEIARAAEGLIKGIVNAAGEVLDFLGQLWGALNNRSTTPGTPATYSRGAYSGSYNPNSENLFQLLVSGIRYEWGGSIYNPLIEQTITESSYAGPVRLSPGYRLFIKDWPVVETREYGGKTYSYYMDYVFTYIMYEGPGEPARQFAGYAFVSVKSDAQITIRVTPANPSGAIPYLPDVPAVPAVADSFALVPVVAVAAKAAAVLPATTSNPAKARQPVALPRLPQPMPGVAPLVEVAPSIGGAARQITTATGTLRKLSPAEVPRIAPLPARPIPNLQPQITPAGQTLPAPAPAPATTPTDLRKYGSQLITAIGVRPDLAAIAEEVGRIEQKTARMLQDRDTTPDWLNGAIGPLLNQLKDAIIDALVVDVPATVYEFEAPCDKDTNGDPVVLEQAIAAADYQPAIVARLDAIAEAMGVLKGWKQPMCRTSPPRSNVTVTAYEYNPEA